MPFCTQCGVTLDNRDRFCPQCGVKVRATQAIAPELSPAPRSMPAPLPRLDPPATGPESPGDRSLGVEPSASYDSLSFSVADDSASGGDTRRRRMLVAIVCFLLLALSGWAGYRILSRPGAEGEAAAVDATEQPLEEPPSARSRTVGAAEQWAVVSEFTKATTDPANALGAPDQRVAVVAPRGAVALTWVGGAFYNGEGPDIRIHGLFGERASYTVFVRSGSEAPWRQFDINRKGFADGTASHDFGHHGIQQADQIMMRNDGSSPLYLDAITPLYLQPQAHDEDESAGHHDPH